MELLPRDTEQEQSERVGKDPRRLGTWHTNTGLGFHTFNRGQKVETRDRRAGAGRKTTLSASVAAALADIGCSAKEPVGKEVNRLTLFTSLIAISLASRHSLLEEGEGVPLQNHRWASFLLFV